MLCGLGAFELQHLYRMLAMVCEALSFVYIGIALPKLGSPSMGKGWIIAPLLVLFCIVGRGASTAVCSFIVNKTRGPSERLSKPMQRIIWMAGLRGGVAFALASAASQITADHEVGEMLPPLTLFIVLISMVSITSTLPFALRKLGLTTSNGAARQPGASASIELAPATQNSVALLQSSAEPATDVVIETPPTPALPADAAKVVAQGSEGASSSQASAEAGASFASPDTHESDSSAMLSPERERHSVRASLTHMASTAAHSLVNAANRALIRTQSNQSLAQDDTYGASEDHT